MALEKQLVQYANEAKFTSKFLVPLLQRLGFSVVEYHGTQEFGKDVIFAEVDRFGQIAYHGLQAKYLGSIGQSQSIGLVTVCKQAFNIPFTHPVTGTEERIRTFTVANAGSIAPNAKKVFFESLGNPHGGQIRMLDGKTLLGLDRWATVQQVESAGEYLSGLLLELRYNAGLLKGIRRMTEKYLSEQTNPLPVERLRTAATAHYLTRPFMSSHIDINVVSDYLNCVGNVINRIRDAMSFGSCSKENRRNLAELMLTHIDTAMRLGEEIAASVEIALRSLGPLAGV